MLPPTSGVPLKSALCISATASHCLTPGLIVSIAIFIASCEIIAAPFISFISASDFINLIQLTSLSESLIFALGKPCFNFS